MSSSVSRWQARRTDKRNLRAIAIHTSQADRSARDEALAFAYGHNSRVVY